MSNKIGIIVPYFGKFSELFKYWYISAKNNKNIDFLLYTDNDNPFTPVENIKWNKMTLKEFSEKATEKIGLRVNIKRAYKLCDFKPAYGKIFEDELKSGGGVYFLGLV